MTAARHVDIRQNEQRPKDQKTHTTFTHISLPSQNYHRPYTFASDFLLSPPQTHLRKREKNLKNISGLHHSDPSSLFLTTPSAVSSACLDLLQRSSYDILWRTFVAITDLHLRPRRRTSDIEVDLLHYIGSFTSCTIERRASYHICDVHRQTRHGFNGAKPSRLGQGPSSSRHQFSIHLEC